MIPVYCYIYIVTFTNIGENIGNNYSVKYYNLYLGFNW